MKLLIITQYFPPEVGAPQNRLYELAVRLQKEGIEVEVLTAMPNYPAMEIHPGYRKKWYVNEKQGEIATHRSWIFVPKSKKVPARLLNYFSFVFSSFFIGWFKTNKPDLILCESPPLFLGISAWALAKIKGAKFIFNVSDLWPESAEKLGLVRNRFFLSISTRLEEFLYRNAVLITGQTQGIVQNIKSRFPQQQVHWLPNGVDLQFYNPAQYNQKWKHENGFSSEDFVLLYAGIIGHAQGLEVIIHAAAALRETPAIKFVLMGAGPEKAHLQALCTQLHLTSVQFFPPVTKEQMPAIIAASDAAIIPLKRLELFKGAIPSKIFEALAMEKPILLGVEGEAKSLFIESGDCGLAFVPEDVAELSQCILKLQSSPSLCKQLGTNGRKFVAAHFNRNQIASDFHKKLHEVFQHSIR
ncbi:MAG: glycosyltransferase family 4 protein [Bacteroidia bacterium]|nr:glycosyltransferase family 4 protein [Bacteroidia bacterium]MCC6768270.1 glycosyltransferase family 4 protein [Bacteroidia bacterium]